MNESLELEIKVKSYRSVPNPYYLTDDTEAKTAKMYYVICDVKDIPKNIPMKTNPREQKLTTGVAKKIITSLTQPGNRNFYLLNRGLLLSAESVTFNSINNTINIVFSDLSVHGNIDGGHTYKIIQKYMDDLDYGQQYVKLEILTGVEEIFQELAAARNTSVQVQDKSIAELEQRFELIKECIKNEPFYKEIFFKENDSGSIDVSDILSILNLFNIDRYEKLNEFPIISYSGKKQCIDYYINIHKQQGDSLNNPYKKMSRVMVDFFKLYDEIEKNMRKFYSNGIPNKRYGQVSGVITKKEGKPSFKTRFYNNNIDYITPKGFLMPILGSFRALLVQDNDGYYAWKYNPFEILESVGADLVESTIEMSRDLGNNPQSAGKNKQLWKNLYMCVLMESMQREK